MACTLRTRQAAIYTVCHATQSWIVAGLTRDGTSGIHPAFCIQQLGASVCEDTRMLRSRRLTLAAVVAVVFHITQFSLWAAPPQELHGVVKDRSGAVIAHAQILLHADGQEISRTTQADGSFLFTGVTATSGTLVVSASGLPTGVDDVEAQPDAVSVSSTQLQQWGALATDDKLRNVAGFSLLRRSGSQTANPTSQGVSLRGLGASGASRALVLADGIPLNDPFGGWIYWARVPQASLDQVQLIPGGVSALYGNDALGGVVNLETRHAVQTDASV